MAGSIGDLILQMMGRKDPRDEIIANAMNGGGAQPPAQPPAAPPAVQPPPNGQPQPPVTTVAPPIPESMKSPPDLAQMYIKLMERSDNAAQIDSGLALIAAGSAHPENRPGLMALAANRGRGGAGGLGIEELLKIRELQMGEQELARSRAQLPALMKQYNLDPATVTYLDAAGQLDEVISALANPDTEVVESADGSKKLINSKDGSTIRELSAKRPRDTEYVELGDGSKVLVYSDDKTEVATGKPLGKIGAPIKREIIKDYKGANVLVEDGKMVGTITEGDPNQGDSQLTRSDGSVALIDKDGNVKKELSGPKVDRQIIKAADESNVLVEDGRVIGTITEGDPNKGDYTVTRSDGSVARFDKNNQLVRELSEPEVLNADDKDHLASINRERAKAGQPAMTTEEFLNTVGKKAATTEINVGEDGTRFPKPAEGYDYDRNPDGTVKMYPDGPHQHIIKGSKAELDAATAKQKLTAEEAAAAEAEEGIAGGRTSEVVKKSIVDQEIDDAIAIIEENKDNLLGVTGWGGLLAGMPSSDPNSALALSTALGTIKTNIGLNELRDMRAASPTGAALGNVTEKENAMLQRVMGSLTQTGDDDALVYDLRRLKAATNLVINGIHDPNSPKAKSNGYREPTEAEIQAAIDAVPKSGEMYPGEEKMLKGGVRARRTK